MTLATICNGVAVRVGVKPPSSWINNPDLTALEILTWVRDAQVRLASEHRWQQQIREAAVVLPALTEPTLAMGSGRIVPGSMWTGTGQVASLDPDSTTAPISTDYLTGWVPRWRVEGPLEPSTWEAVRRGEMVTTWPVWTLQGNKVHLLGTTSGDVLVYRYSMSPTAFAADTDTAALGVDFERAIELCATWLYRDAKGLPAQSAQGQYLEALAKLKADDLPVDAMQMGTRRRRGQGEGRTPDFVFNESRMT